MSKSVGKSPKTVSLDTMAESLAAVSPTGDGYKADTAAVIRKRLAETVDGMWADVDHDKIPVGDARALQDTYIAQLRAGQYGEDIAARWVAAEKASQPS